MLSPCGIKILKENLNEQNQICQYPVFDPAPLCSIAGIKRPSSFRMMVRLWHLASPNPIWRHLNSVKKCTHTNTHIYKHGLNKALQGLKPNQFSTLCRSRTSFLFSRFLHMVWWPLYFPLCLHPVLFLPWNPSSHTCGRIHNLRIPKEVQAYPECIILGDDYMTLMWLHSVCHGAVGARW